MSNIFQHTKEYSVYPGEYIPQPDIERMLDELVKNEQLEDSDARIEDLPSYYSLEIVIGTVKREEVLAYIHGNILSVTVFHKPVADPGKDVSNSVKRNEWHIALPKNTDAAFVTADIHGGVLRFYLSKTTGEMANPQLYPIVIY